MRFKKKYSLLLYLKTFKNFSTFTYMSSVCICTSTQAESTSSNNQICPALDQENQPIGLTLSSSRI